LLIVSASGLGQFIPAVAQKSKKETRGEMEYWSDGVLEYWVEIPITPILHSFIPPLTSLQGGSSVELMRRLFFSVWLVAILLFSGCASFQVTSQVQAGRRALIISRPEEALAYFQRAAEADPNYVMEVRSFREGIWTYVGRAQYGAGKLAEARQSLEKAVAANKDDYMARLYLGLTLVRTGDRSRGLKEIEIGLKGLYDWLEFTHYNAYYGWLWDPNRELRSEMENALAMISGKDINWETLIASAEWVGRKMEEELDVARQDERREFRERDSIGRRGFSLGVGIGF
jgi:tetratricopeptide (TPR) repeat protein